MIKKVANGKEIDLHDFDYTCVKISQTILDAITHKLRQQILQTINKHKKISVTQLQQQLGLKQTVTSKHLAILRKFGLVKGTRKGAVIEYSINQLRMQAVLQLAKEFSNRMEAFI